MHSIAEIGTNVPAFLGKLWKMVEDSVTNDLIAWSSTGTSFVIKDEIRFARELLPMYYKHNNMASFIRQLNMYGFHKIVSPDAGSMKLETPNEIKFTHPFFVRGHPYLLDNIKRKIGVSKVLPGQLGEKTPQVINKVLNDVRQMKGRQESMDRLENGLSSPKPLVVSTIIEDHRQHDSRLTAMKLENGALWRELSVLRQKHMKQQQMVNKLIQFLMTIVQQNHSNFSVKRKYPRMLQHHEKHSQQEVTHPDDQEPQHTNFDYNSNSPTGPVIHELDPTEALLETVVEEVAVDTSNTNVPDYFLNSTESKDIREMASNTEIAESVNVFPMEDVNPEIIIGMPEDTLFPDVDSQTTSKTEQRSQKKNGSTSVNKTSRQTFNHKTMKKGQEILRPKYIKLLTKKKKNVETIRPKPVVVINHQKQMEQELQQQLQINQNQLDINKQQLIKCEQEKQRLHFQPQSHQKMHKVPRNGHANVKQTQNQPVESKTEQLSNTERILLQRLQQSSSQQPSPVNNGPVITIPFDSGLTENPVSEMNDSVLDPLLMNEGTENFGLPVVVEVPAAVMSPHDLLLGSPVLSHDPVMTPQMDPSPNASSPQESPPHDMQVACVDDPGTATSANLVTRSAHHQLFKIDPSDYSRSEMDCHIDSVQNDLDNLKELLRSEGISLDANTLLGYFNDDPLSYNLPDPLNGEEPKESSGNELMTCNPMFDFTDLIGNDWSLPTSPGDNATTEVTAEDSFAEVNTPQFVMQSPSFPTPSKKRKK